ncbi:hypothetical protein D3C87_1202780 [compost metagenome]
MWEQTLTFRNPLAIGVNVVILDVTVEVFLSERLDYRGDDVVPHVEDDREQLFVLDDQLTIIFPTGHAVQAEYFICIR